MAIEPDNQHTRGQTECYAINTSATWYHPEWCHGFDHHEWIHAELARKKKSLDGAYEAMARSNDVGAKTLDLLRALYDATKNNAPPELSARVKTFLNAADWHEALSSFTSGNE
jgi:hypothetical protein